MDSDNGRAPLKELQNVQPDNNRLLQTSLKASGVNRKSLIAKHSSIPKPPRSSRHTTVRSVKTEVSHDVPPPSRVTTKPRRTVNTSFRQNCRTPLQSDQGRRSAASLNFTHGASSTRPGLSSRRASHLEDASNIAMSSIAQNFDVSSLPQAISNAVKEAMKPRMDQDRRAEVEDIVKKHMHTMSSEKKHNQAAEALKLRSEILDLKVRLRDAESKVLEERSRANGMDLRVAELQKENASAQDNNDSIAQIAPDEFEKLQGEFAESINCTKDLEKQVQSLENEVASKREMLVEQGRRAEEVSSHLKDAMFRAERIQTDLSCRESELRRIKREKEELQSEREDILDTIKKRTSCLQEERQRAEDLRAELERNKRARDKDISEMEAKMLSYRQELEPKIAFLEEERAKLQRNHELTLSEVKNRIKELDSLKQTISILESNIARLNCDKRSQDMEIEVLNEDNAKSTKQITDLAEAIRKHKEEIHLLEQQAREDATVRRKLHNTIQELKGNIRVFARIRPLLDGEVKDGGSEGTIRDMFEYTERGQGVTAATPTNEETAGDGPVKRSRYPFKFDRVFDPTSTQGAIFEEISQLVQSALDGYRVCIFAYGQTGSGKTHTMLGNREDGEKNLGMIPRSVRQIFDTAKAMEKDEWTFKLKASFLEIYNEIIRDLLIDSKSSSNCRPKDSRVKEEPYKIRFIGETNLCTVQDLTIEEVKNEGQLQRLIDLSMKRRTTAATKANERSSRSHSVFRLYIEGHNSLTGEKRSGLLNLIDLAGSERLSHSKAEGDRLRETKNINRSLSALGDVIAALANKDKHIPFRNSKLTHVLQDSLGGDSKTLMFVNISHAPASFHESLTSLRFAAKVNSCHVGTAKRSTRIDL